VNTDRVDSDVEVVAGRRTIVTALPLKAAARQRLAELLQARVLDVREPCDDPDLVLTPACSPQLIGALGRKYNGAPVIVVELDDWAYGIELPGPVKRILRSGAAAFVLADSIDELAAKIASRPDAPQGESDPASFRELTPGSTVEDLIAAFLRDSVEHSTRHRVNDA
jgi:hypothetical protein